MKSLSIIFCFTLLFVSNSFAESYIIKKGDTLWGISKRHGVTVGLIQQSNPKIKNINRIQVGWKLEIPTGNRVSVRAKNVRTKAASSGIPAHQKVVFDGWVRPGANKYWKGKPEGLRFLKAMDEGMQILGYSEDDRKGLIEEIANARWEETYISHAKYGGLVKSQKDGAKYRMIKMVGKNSNGRVEIITGPNGVIPSWSDSENAYPARLYRSGETFFLLPWICDNPTMVVLVPPSKKPPVRVSPPKPDEPKAPPVTKTDYPTQEECDNWDLYNGFGHYESRVDSSDNQGWYQWNKARARICKKMAKNSLGIKQIGVGVAAFVAGGKGVAARHYDYDWYQLAIGPTLKINAEYSDYDFDALVGYLYNNGSWMGKEDRDQRDLVAILSGHANIYREDPDAKWFWKTEFNVERRIVLDTKMKKGTKSDNNVLEVAYRQWIYPIEIGENGMFVVSPGFSIVGGIEYGAEDKEFLKVGPGFEFSSNKYVVGALFPADRKFQGNGQWEHSFYASPDGIYRAYQASNTKAVTQEQIDEIMRGNSESKLLKNPADFL
ncbi:MAG: LysM peptidoglycan-binding domain-containing protein [Sphingobacteriia bacterium]|nr:LysM peptidoglycan-binding domain-containing protein [Sphingobacteriia bacterium]